MTAFQKLSATEQTALIDRVVTYFDARPEYAIRIDGKNVSYYSPSTYQSDDPQKQNTVRSVKEVVTRIGTTTYGPEAIRAHLMGEAFIGVYPIRDDSTVRWFALDFDRKDPTDPDPMVEAKRQLSVLKDAGIPVYLERSQSGNGVHLWGFLAEPTNAGRLRHALSPLIESSDTYDRMFPNQAGVDLLRPLGNLIALPFHGKRMEDDNSVFLQDDGTDRDQWEFLRSDLQTVPTSVIDALFESAGKYTAEFLRTEFKGESETRKDSWKITHPVFGSSFIRYCWDHAETLSEPVWYALACQFSQFVDGRDLFHKWSAQDTRRYDARQCDRKYTQAVQQNKPHTCEAIRNLGVPCDDDTRFPKVRRPADLADILFVDLLQDMGTEQDTEQTIVSAREGFDNVREWLFSVEKDPTIGQGYPFGIPDLDETCGMRDGNLVIVAARPSIGKSALAGHIIDELAEQHVATLFCSLEMTSKEFYSRQLAKRTKVSSTRMKKGQLTRDDWDKIDEWLDELTDASRYPVHVDEWSLSIERIYESAGRLHHEYDGRIVVIVDYLQLVQQESNESEYSAVSRVSSQLKRLAKVLQIPVIALAQLNRAADGQGTEGEALDSWLRGSGKIEQDADVIIFMLGQRGPGVVERTLVIQKDRHGSAGVRFTIDFNQPLMQFGPRGKWMKEGTYHTFDGDAPMVSPQDPDLFGPLVEDPDPVKEEPVPVAAGPKKSKWAMTYEEANGIKGGDWEF